MIRRHSDGGIGVSNPQNFGTHGAQGIRRDNDLKVDDQPFKRIKKKNNDSLVDRQRMFRLRFGRSRLPLTLYLDIK